MKINKKHENKRNELFLSISKMIERDGYENLTIRGICKELSISTGTFYHYFPEKSDLALALFAHIDQYFASEVTPKFTDFEPDNLILFLESYCDYIMQNGVETCRCINITPLKNNSSNYLNDKREIHQILYKIIDRGIQKGQYKSTLDVADTVRTLLIIARGYSSDWVKCEGTYNLKDAMQSFIHTFLPVLSKKTIFNK